MINMENIEINEKENHVAVKINPKIYPLPIVYQAADIFIDKCWVFLSGDPDTEINVTLMPKESLDLKQIAGEFSNELLNYSSLLVRSQLNKELRELIVKRAFFTATKDEEEKEKKFEEKMIEKQKIDIGARVPIMGETKKITEELLDETEEKFDTEEIAKPWEEQKGAIKKDAKEILDELEKEKS